MRCRRVVGKEQAPCCALMHTHVHAHANACRKVDRPKAWTGTNNQGSQKQVRSAGERHTRQQQPTMQKSTLFRV